MSKQTVVEILENKLKQSKYFYKLMEDLKSQNTVVGIDIFEQAKEMEKQQIINAYVQGFIESENMDKDAEQYYNRKFNK
jgi:hypothetical protein